MFSSRVGGVRGVVRGVYHAVELLVRLHQVRRHRHRIVQIGERAFGMCRARAKHALHFSNLASRLRESYAIRAMRVDIFHVPVGDVVIASARYVIDKTRKDKLSRQCSFYQSRILCSSALSSDNAFSSNLSKKSTSHGPSRVLRYSSTFSVS